MVFILIDILNFIYQQFNKGEIDEKINPADIYNDFATISSRM